MCDGVGLEDVGGFGGGEATGVYVSEVHVWEREIKGAELTRRGRGWGRSR